MGVMVNNKLPTDPKDDHCLSSWNKDNSHGVSTRRPFSRHRHDRVDRWIWVWNE